MPNICATPMHGGVRTSCTRSTKAGGAGAETMGDSAGCGDGSGVVSGGGATAAADELVAGVGVAIGVDGDGVANANHAPVAAMRTIEAAMAMSFEADFRGVARAASRAAATAEAD